MLIAWLPTPLVWGSRGGGGEKGGGRLKSRRDTLVPWGSDGAESSQSPMYLTIDPGDDQWKPKGERAPNT